MRVLPVFLEYGLKSPIPPPQNLYGRLVMGFQIVLPMVLRWRARSSVIIGFYSLVSRSRTPKLLLMLRLLLLLLAVPQNEA